MLDRDIIVPCDIPPIGLKEVSFTNRSIQDALYLTFLFKQVARDCLIGKVKGSCTNFITTIKSYEFASHVSFKIYFTLSFCL